MQIRPVRPSEFAELGGMTVAAFQGLEGGGDLGDYAKTLANVADRALHAQVLVAVEGDLLVGGVTYVPDRSNAYSEDLQEGEAGIRMLAVSPDARRRGAGRALTEACIELARVRGVRRLALHSTPRMGAAHALYESLGFRRAPGRDLVVPPGLRLLSFVLDVTADGAERAQPER